MLARPTVRSSDCLSSRVSAAAKWRAVAWGEISDSLATWTLPGERTKNGAAHGVPLSAPARDILRAGLPDGADHRGAAGGLLLPGAFGTPFAGWSKAKQALDKAIMDARAKAARAAGTSLAPLIPWNVHDLRRTVATGLQRLGVRLEVTEAVLNHISGSRGGIAGVYQRHDWAAEKRAALDSWAAHVLAVAKGSPDAHKSGDIETSHGVNTSSPKAPGVLARREGPTPLLADPLSTPSAASNLRAGSTYLRSPCA